MSQCHARAPITGWRCELPANHEDDMHQAVVDVEDGISRMVWCTCDEPDEYGNPCLRVVSHRGEHQQ